MKQAEKVYRIVCDGKVLMFVYVKLNGTGSKVYAIRRFKKPTNTKTIPGIVDSADTEPSIVLGLIKAECELPEDAQIDDVTKDMAETEEMLISIRRI